MKFCGLIPITNNPLAVTTVTTFLLFNTPSLLVEAKRRGNKNHKNNASGTKGLFGNGDLKFFLNANSQGNKNQVKPSFGGFGGFNSIVSSSPSSDQEFNPTFSTECQPSAENVESASNSQKCSCPKSVTGMGRGYFPGYVFDQDKMECTQIISGSPFQGRSLNFFLSQDECIGACLVPERVVIKSGLDNNNNNNNNQIECRPSRNRNPSDQDRCSCEASKRGMQRGYFPGFVYNLESNSCESLISGGYHGRTINWFTSESDCESACVVREQEVNKEDLTLKFGFGFGGGADIEPDYDCLGEPQFAGMCRAMMTRFSYNVENHKCEAQLYGGCGGYTTNSFPSMELCEKTCTAAPKKEKEEKERVSIPRAAEPQDPVKTVSAQPATNDLFKPVDNGFFLDDFLSSYSQKFESDINLIFGCSDENPCACPKNIGRAGFGLKSKQWYYSSVNNKCVDFIYKGFGGNQNRFESEAACNKKCIQGSSNTSKTSDKNDNQAITIKSSACNDKYLGDMVNSCRAMVFRWSYNSINNQCEKVIWGGCASFFGQVLEDSANNFATQGDCLRICKPGSESSATQQQNSYSRSFSLPSASSNSGSSSDSNTLKAEPRCNIAYPVEDGNGINNVYYAHKGDGRCRPVSYSQPQILSENVNLFHRFIDCRKACQPEVFAQIKQGRGRK